MMGDYQVRFCERLRVKLPLPTRLATRCVQYRHRKNSNDKYSSKTNITINVVF